MNVKLLSIYNTFKLLDQCRVSILALVSLSKVVVIFYMHFVFGLIFPRMTVYCSL